MVQTYPKIGHPPTLLEMKTVPVLIHLMMTSSSWNIFRVIGLLCEKFTDHRWLPRTKASDAELWCFLWSASERIVQYNYVIMGAMASQISDVSIVYSNVCSDQRKHQSSASLAFVRGLHWWPVNSPHRGPVTRKMFPFDDVIMWPNNSDAGDLRRHRSHYDVIVMCHLGWNIHCVTRTAATTVLTMERHNSLSSLGTDFNVLRNCDIEAH